MAYAVSEKRRQLFQRIKVRGVPAAEVLNPAAKRSAARVSVYAKVDDKGAAGARLVIGAEVVAGSG